MIHKTVKKAAFSMMGAGASSTLYLVLARVMDEFINRDVSNLIALLIGSFVNFFVQRKTFMEKVGTSKSILMKYAFVEISLIITQQLGVTYVLNNKKEYLEEYFKNYPEFIKKEYNTIARIFVASTIFIVASFPLRHMWVFKK